MCIFSPVTTSSLIAAGFLLASYQSAASQSAQAQPSQTPAPQNAPAQNAPPAAQSDIITSITPDAMAAIMRDAGYKADVYEFGTTTKHKAVATAMEGYKVRVYFYSCDPQNKCGSLNFETSFTKSPNFTQNLTNKWNAEHRYTKLYIDPSDGSLNFDFDIFVYGGVTTKTVKDAVTLYDGTLGDLAKFLP